ncbi:hypothetical protein NJF44_24565 [Pseudomonas guariconensis]|nr:MULTISPECIES: hypothetical protein [Pseudomonas]MCO7517921.1 hypothetical protein [Pseudomonas putida]MCO7608406.1 hypothetical protein [Pseudomonas guariconensis]
MKLKFETTKSGHVVVVGIGLGEQAPVAVATAPIRTQKIRDCKKVSMSK